MRRALLSLGLVALASAALGAPEAMALGAPEAMVAKKRGVKLKVADSEYGKVLMNGGGKALYLFTKDGKGPSDCYGDCASVWPPLLTKGKPVARRGVAAKGLGTTRRDDGRRQVTYGGHPLYFYVHDSPGVILCQDVFEFGGHWLLVDGAGKAVR